MISAIGLGFWTGGHCQMDLLTGLEPTSLGSENSGELRDILHYIVYMYAQQLHLSAFGNSGYYVFSAHLSS